MSINLISGSTTNQMTVDPTSTAARMSLYTTDGLAVHPTDLYRGIASINVRQTATTGAGAATWAIYNSSTTKIINIKGIYLQLFFDGASAATLMKYEFVKGTGVTTFSGGTTVTPMNKNATLASPSASIRVLDTGLTTTNAIFGGSMLTITMGRIAASGTNFFNMVAFFGFEAFREFPIELATNEIFTLRQLATSVVGDNVVGYVEFSEV